MKEKRKGTLRRQFNEAFCNPDGSFAITKTVAVFGQISALYHFNTNFVALLDKWDSLLVIMGFVIAPDVVKKVIAMKYGGSAK